MSRLILSFFLISLCLITTLAHSSQNFTVPTVEKLSINGMNVYLINTHTGNGVSLSINAHVGALHDEPTKLAGRAHLWEHVIHTGSKKYPGYNSFDQLMESSGAQHNAGTAPTYTTYYYRFHPDALERVTSVVGAMISAPEWNEESFQREKRIVMNEALTYQAEPYSALGAMVHLHTLPKGHPFGMYDIGTQEQLEAMSLDDLKDLFYTGYGAASMPILLAGNFDPLPDGSFHLTRDRALKSLKDHFFTPNVSNDPNGYVIRPESLQKKHIPPLVTEPSDEKAPESRFIEVGGKENERLLLLKWSVTPSFLKSTQKAPLIAETYLDYLNLSNKGSFLDTLKSAGWITWGSFRTQKVNNHFEVEAIFGITENGYAHRWEVPKVLSLLLENIENKGLSAKLLGYLRQRNIISYASRAFEYSKATDYVDNALRSGIDYQRTFDFDWLYGSISNSEIKNATAQLFGYENMVGGYLGPEVISDKLAPIFERPFLHVTSKKVIGPRNESLYDTLAIKQSKVELSNLKLSLANSPMDLPNQETRLYDTGLAGTTVILAEDHARPVGAIMIGLKGKLPNPQMLASLKVLFSAFQRRYAADLDFLSSMGITPSLEFTGGTVVFKMSGNSMAAKSGLIWFISALKNFTPTREETEYGKAIAKMDYEGSFSEMPGLTASNKLINSIARALHDQKTIFTESQKVTPKLIKRKMAQFFERVDLRVILTGDYSIDSANEVLTHTRNLFPKRLHAKDRKKQNVTVSKVSHEGHFWSPIGANHDQTAYGISRVYEGAKPGTKEWAALEVLIAALYTENYALNRIEKGLGYVQDVAALKSANTMKILFIGQTDAKRSMGSNGEEITLETGSERATSLRQGWGELIQKIKSRTLSSDSFTAVKTALIREKTMLPKNPEMALAQLQYNYFTLGAFNEGSNIEYIQDLSAEEIYSIGEKYLLKQPYLEVEISAKKPNCEDLLTSIKKVKKSLGR